MFIHKPEPYNPQHVGSVYRVVPVLPVGAVNSPSQQLDAQAKQLVPGDTYEARVLQRVSDTTFLVQINSKQPQPLLLKMDIGQQAQMGQTLSLQYLQAKPELTFLLKQPVTAYAETETTVNLSKAGSLLGTYLGQAQAEHVSTRYQASAVVTHHPSNPERIAQDLKHTLTKSGLFYESHLQAFTQGQYTLQQLTQEPQNQTGFNPAQITFQQLAVLEQQRFSWHGHIWAGQPMQWDIYRQRLPAETHHPGKPTEQAAWVATELKIDFPQLGEVKAKLMLANGRLRIHVESARTDTLHALQQQKSALMQAMETRQQPLDGFTLALASATSHKPGEA